MRVRVAQGRQDLSTVDIEVGRSGTDLRASEESHRQALQQPQPRFFRGVDQICTELVSFHNGSDRSLVVSLRSVYLLAIRPCTRISSQPSHNQVGNYVRS
jgi:hypothetical protein